MLGFAIEYQAALESLTADQKNDLKQFKLAEVEGVIAKEVCDTLKVCHMACSDNANHWSSVDPQGHNSLLLMCNTKPSNSDPSYGLHQYNIYRCLSTHQQIQPSFVGCG